MADTRTNAQRLAQRQGVVTYNPYTLEPYRGEKMTCDQCGKQGCQVSNNLHGETLIQDLCFECLNAVAFDQFWGDAGGIEEFKKWCIVRD